MNKFKKKSENLILERLMKIPVKQERTLVLCTENEDAEFISKYLTEHQIPNKVVKPEFLQGINILFHMSLTFSEYL